MARITILMDNQTTSDELACEHGLSMWIELNGQTVLFDTGQSDLFTANAWALGIHLTAADAIVLSHGHYDHTGGLSAALAAARQALIVAHPGIRMERYSRKADGHYKPVGLPHEALAAMAKHSGEIVWNEGPFEVVPGLWTTGTIPRLTDYEDTGGAFYLDTEGNRPDPIEDDQALYFDGSAGTVVLLGCAHAGVVNTLREIRRQTAGRPIEAVLGGMHLGQASDERLRQTITALQELDIPCVYPMHCTGQKSSDILREAMGDRCQSAGAGTVLEFA